jgi:hypothetical protein
MALAGKSRCIYGLRLALAVHLSMQPERSSDSATITD